MIVSKYGTSYDTADGSEQPHAPSEHPRQPSEREQINRWEDDGPGPHAHTVNAIPDPPRSPTWSVLSLRRLAEAIRCLTRREDADRLREEADQSERELAAAQHDRQRSAADYAYGNRYRNAWENT